MVKTKTVTEQQFFTLIIFYDSEYKGNIYRSIWLVTVQVDLWLVHVV